MGKVLVNENEIAADLVISNTKDAVELINSKLLEKIKKLGLEIKDEVIQDLLKGTGTTKKLYMATVKADLVKIKNPAIKNGMQFQADDAWNSFENAYIPIRREVGSNYQYISVVDGKVVLSLESENLIREAHHRYITDPKEIEAYNLHAEIVEKINQLFNGKIPYRWFSIFLEDGTGKMGRNDLTDYSKLV